MARSRHTTFSSSPHQWQGTYVCSREIYSRAARYIHCPAQVDLTHLTSYPPPKTSHLQPPFLLVRGGEAGYEVVSPLLTCRARDEALHEFDVNPCYHYPPQMPTQRPVVLYICTHLHSSFQMYTSAAVADPSCGPRQQARVRGTIILRATSAPPCQMHSPPALQATLSSCSSPHLHSLRAYVCGCQQMPRAVSNKTQG